MPFHPFLVHFPIAFLFGAMILHGIHLWRHNWICRAVGLWMIGLAALSSIFASISGGHELKKAGEIGYPIEVIQMMNRHELMGNIITWGTIIFFICWVYLFFKRMDDRRIDKLAMAFIMLLVILVSSTAYLGEQLVWVHGVGTP